VTALRPNRPALVVAASQAPQALGAVQVVPAPATSGVTRLVLTDFRSYTSLRLDVEAAPVVLTGANGAGKTNLLEALSFLAPGRGLRAARLGSVGRHAPGAPGMESAAPWAVAATLTTPSGTIDVGTGLVVNGNERRTVRIDGVTVRGSAALGRHMGTVWLTPAMDRLFLDGPSGRRKFIDRLVTAFDPDHAGRTAAFDHAYRQRLRLLKDGATDSAWFAALEDSMARHGVALSAARRDLVDRLNRDLIAAAGLFPAARLSLIGAIDKWLGEMPAVDVEDKMRRALADERRGGPATGPHRSDLFVAMAMPGHASNGQPAALCSTGEQKALLIAVLLAHARLQRARRGHAPMLLLDEVAAHLDKSRRAALFGEILALGAQAWMTGTDAALFEGFGSRAQFFTVDRTVLQPQPPP